VVRRTPERARHRGTRRLNKQSNADAEIIAVSPTTDNGLCFTRDAGKQEKRRPYEQSSRDHMHLMKACVGIWFREKDYGGVPPLGSRRSL
jgi:hypothetical protein